MRIASGNRSVGPRVVHYLRGFFCCILLQGDAEKWLTWTVSLRSVSEVGGLKPYRLQQVFTLRRPINDLKATDIFIRKIVGHNHWL